MPFKKVPIFTHSSGIIEYGEWPGLAKDADTDIFSQ
jgi:hypothetical protein